MRLRKGFRKQNALLCFVYKVTFLYLVWMWDCCDSISLNAVQFNMGQNGNRCYKNSQDFKISLQETVPWNTQILPPIKLTGTSILPPFHREKFSGCGIYYKKVPKKSARSYFYKLASRRMLIMNCFVQSA